MTDKYHFWLYDLSFFLTFEYSDLVKPVFDEFIFREEIKNCILVIFCHGRKQGALLIHSSEIGIFKSNMSKGETERAYGNGVE